MRSEVVATSPYPIKSRVPVYCGIERGIRIEERAAVPVGVSRVPVLPDDWPRCEPDWLTHRMSRLNRPERAPVRLRFSANNAAGRTAIESPPGGNCAHKDTGFEPVGCAVRLYVHWREIVVTLAGFPPANPRVLSPPAVVIRALRTQGRKSPRSDLRRHCSGPKPGASTLGYVAEMVARNGFAPVTFRL